ncbi:hypothetical protein O7627_10140 [Solwaraspora sp. WMMD1047]|uniref:hypothetical protein n=1 Tax=Solwaraspora sp. WMMD1047 TaxID=3016102 RepID=UPI002415BC0B|nr:hypothetical protein [Solwaraspora sp. WMMD1047]MDG4829662.1 hypothetical protein [Solwaraspora sp. WMMD1047]
MLRGGALAALAAAVGTLTGCDLLDREPEPAPEPDPLAPLLAGALDLAARHQRAIADHPQLADLLGPIEAAHRAHAEELARLTGTGLPSSTPALPSSNPPAPTGGPASAGDPAAVRAELRAAEQRGREAAAEACLAAPAERATLVGTIAAARAAHAEVLT